MNRSLTYLSLSLCSLWVPALNAANLGQVLLPDSADWFLHLDADQLRNTRSGSAFLREFREIGRQQLPQELPIDPLMVLDNIRGLTLFGSMPEMKNPSPENIDAVIVLQGTPSLMQVFRGVISGLQLEKPEAVQTIEQGGFSILSIQQGAFNGSFIGEESLVMAKQLSSLQGYLLSRQQPGTGTTAAGKFPGYLEDPAAGIFLGAHVEGMDVLDGIPVQARILKMTRAVSLQLGEANDAVQMLAGLVTDSPTTGQQVSEVLRGIIALTAMTQTGQPDIAALLASASVRLQDSTVQVRLAYPAAAVEQWAIKLADMARASLQEQIQEEAEQAEEIARSAAEKAQADYEAALAAAELARKAAEEARKAAEEARMLSESASAE